MAQIPTIPELTIDTLQLIIGDAVKKYPAIEAVGLVGSYTRGEHTHTSDVDLVIKISQDSFSKALETFGVYVSGVLEKIANYPKPLENKAPCRDYRGLWIVRLN